MAAHSLMHKNLMYRSNNKYTMFCIIVLAYISKYHSITRKYHHCAMKEKNTIRTCPDKQRHLVEEQPLTNVNESITCSF